MKKILLFTSNAIVAFFMMSFTVAPNMKQQENSYEITASSKTITVYKVTIVGRNAASTQSIQAEFDEDNMELRVVEKKSGRKLTMTYSVVQNPYKGYSDDARGRYDYRAGDYYF